jgi:hypothetical protein
MFEKVEVRFGNSDVGAVHHWNRAKQLGSGAVNIPEPLMRRELDIVLKSAFGEKFCDSVMETLLSDWLEEDMPAMPDIKKWNFDIYVGKQQVFLKDDSVLDEDQCDLRDEEVQELNAHRGAGFPYGSMVHIVEIETDSTVSAPVDLLSLIPIL